MSEVLCIQLLSLWLVNQIVVGEVVECFVLVVKEFLENSFDVGFWCIDVEVEQGGIKLL